MFKQTLELIDSKRKARLEGKYNCIPNPFKRMSEDWAGIEQGRYYGVTANAKVGKTQITDYLFLYNPLDFILNPENKCQYDVEILYFSLEMSKEQKSLQAISYYLNKFYNILIAPKDLRSLSKALDNDVFDAIKKLEPYFDKFYQKVHFIDNIRNRYGIWLEIKNNAEKNGTIVYEKKNYDGKEVTVMKEYIPNNPNKLTICIIDHVSLLSPEQGEDLHTSIGKLSAVDLIKARNIFKFTPVIVQQQASSQESLEHKKLDALRPSLAGLADNKMTQRDVDMLFGLFSPARHEINNFKGYDIVKFGDRFRSLEVLANREGGGNNIYPLKFLGECSYFEELPLPNTQEYRELINSL